MNPHEPVDSSAAAIGAQGLLRLGRYLKDDRYWNAGLTVCDALFQEPYLSTDDRHQGLILHSVYHRPNGWDAAPANPACGAIITRARSPSTCCAKPKASRI